MTPVDLSVLLINRDPYLCETFRDVLEYHGIPHAIVHDGESALAYLGQDTASIIVVEYHLATSDDDQLLHALKALAPDAKFIVTSAQPPSTWSETIERHGFDGFIPKLFDVGDLVPYLRSVAEPDQDEDATEFWNSKR